jgi:hypothetical protein
MGRELRVQAERPWVRLRPSLLSDATICAAAGCRSVSALGEAFTEAPFFPVSGEAPATVAARLQAAAPAHVAAVLAAADGVMRHEFDLLGSGPRALGPSLPWRSDFKTGVEWPRRYAFDLDFEMLTRDSDVKVPWELSRFQHAAWLGQAWQFTRDEAFRAEFARQFADWQRDNPWGYSVNWICAMDVAIRAHNLQWALRLLQRADDPGDGDLVLALARALYLHGEFVERHLESSDVNGNHYLADGVGLVSIGAWFRHSVSGQRWLQLGRRILQEEIFNQVAADGVDFEQSTAYHRFVTEMFLTGFLLLRRAGADVDAAAWTRLHHMFEYIAAYTKPDGLAPLVGDADDGRMQKLAPGEVNDHRYLLSTGAVLFGDAALARAAGRCWPDTWWMLGSTAADHMARLPPAPDPGSTAFPAGGTYILRAPEAHAFIDCAEVGMHGRGGHGHNDILSFELCLGGAAVVTDCGSYLYTADVAARDRFRSTASHNGVQVDGEEVNRFLSPPDLWRLRDDARPADVRWQSRGAGGRLTASHTGYQRLADPVAHQRTFAMNETGTVFALRDELDTHGHHRYTWRFHLAPEATALVEEEAIVVETRGRRILVGWDSDHRLQPGLQSGWVSPSYGVRVPAVVVCTELSTTGPVRVQWVFAHGLTVEAAKRVGQAILGAA